MEHRYKGYILVRNGTREMPWNVYKERQYIHVKAVYREWMGFAETMKQAKADIDSGAYEMCELMCN